VVIAKNPRPNINQILMLTGGFRVSESMIKIGARLAGALNAKVTLMHVTANVPSMYTGLDTIEETLEELLHTDTPMAKHLRKCAQMLDEHNVTSEIKLKHGEPVYEIIREVDGGDYDFIIIGASGATTALKEWFLRNVTKDVIDLVGIPIMVVNQVHAEKMEGTGF
jgi:nucleotide-binding universal stress UspA family protein